MKIRLELHAITCPGEWLCPNGKVALRITSLGSTLESNRVSPIFPLLFHNEFNFKKTFTRLAALTELQRKLEQEFLYAELIQWLSPCNDNAVILATFETNLADLLYPVVNYKGLLAGVDVDLLMEPTRYFPGIIAPKIEISTRTVIEEVLGVCCSSLDGAYVVNPKTIDSKVTFLLFSPDDSSASRLIRFLCSTFLLSSSRFLLGNSEPVQRTMIFSRVNRTSRKFYPYDSRCSF